MSLKCHSAFVHYNMFHDRHSHCGGGNIIGSVFNITNNCSGNHGGFWGGLGAGIGWGLGNLLGGFTGMFSNFGFGGFGMPGMFGGFGFPGFGGFGNFWGGGASSVTHNNDYSKYSSTKTGEIDKDNAEINKLHKKANDLIENADLDATEKDAKIDELIDELEAYKGAKKDDISSTTNDDQIDEIIRTLRSHKSKSNEGDETGEKPVGDQTPKIKIGENEIKISDIDMTTINSWSNGDISKLSNENAIDILKQVNATTTLEGDQLVVNATTNLNLLRLAEKSGLELAFGHNTSLDGKPGALPHIDGKVTNVQYNETDKVITFDLEDDKGKYEMKCTEGGSKLTLVKELENKDEKYTAATAGTEYEIVTTDNDPYAVRTGAAAKKKVNTN